MERWVGDYRVGQLYTISKHSHQESDKGEGVEVVKNEPHDDPVHGRGQFTEKRVHLSSKLPSWARAVTPRIFYITEKAWNYYPYTITETKYEDNCGDSTNIFHNEEILGDHEVTFLDIAFDEIPERYYQSKEDLRHFSSVKTGRGPLREGWREHTTPIMCSYKLVTVKFEVWGLQTRVEQFVHKVIRDILLIGHRQAFAWVDEWCGKSAFLLGPKYEAFMSSPWPTPCSSILFHPLLLCYRRLSWLKSLGCCEFSRLCSRSILSSRFTHIYGRHPQRL
uniref:Phosphatidylinositol transfer protein N-terminal domain-containing protein n=1 Tax=Anolis carolinensis TaxID=28377 RepID=H9G8I5_ANOCA